MGALAFHQILQFLIPSKRLEDNFIFSNQESLRVVARGWSALLLAKLSCVLAISILEKILLRQEMFLYNKSDLESVSMPSQTETEVLNRCPKMNEEGTGARFTAGILIVSCLGN